MSEPAVPLVVDAGLIPAKSNPYAYADLLLKNEVYGGKSPALGSPLDEDSKDILSTAVDEFLQLNCSPTTLEELEFEGSQSVTVRLDEQDRRSEQQSQSAGASPSRYPMRPCGAGSGPPPGL